MAAEASGFERSLVEEKLHDAEARLAKSLQQITVIDGQIRELEVLYKRAQKSKKNASRYNLRLKLSVVSGKSWARPSNTFYPLVAALWARITGQPPPAGPGLAGGRTARGPGRPPPPPSTRRVAVFSDDFAFEVCGLVWEKFAFQDGVG